MNGLKKNFLCAAVLLTGTAFMFIGVFRGEAASVLRKAITVCLGCIGIG